MEEVFIATESDGSQWVMLQDYQKIQQDYLLSDLAIQDLMKQVSVLLQENIQAKELIDTIYEIVSIECRDVGEAHDGIQKDIEEFRRGLTKYAPDVASAASAEPDSSLESVPAVESDTQPRG